MDYCDFAKDERNVKTGTPIPSLGVLGYLCVFLFPDNR